jgi:hypothetical protein
MLVIGQKGGSTRWLSTQWKTFLFDVIRIFAKAEDYENSHFATQELG